MQRRDPHFRHHLKHPLGDALAIEPHEFQVRGGDGIVRFDAIVGVGGRVKLPISSIVRPLPLWSIEQSVATCLPKRLEGDIGVDRIGAVSNEQAVVMDLTGFPCLEDDANLRPFGRPDQVMVHRAAGEQGADLHAIRADGAVGKNQQRVARGDGGVRLVADSIERGDEAGRSFRARPGDIDHGGGPTAMIELLQGRELLIRENRMGDAKPLSMLRRCFQQVAFRPDRALERHDDLFADRIDRGICHLGEELLEVVVDHPRLIRQTGKRGVVTHRTDRIALLADEWQEHELHRLDGEAERLHAGEQ